MALPLILGTLATGAVLPSVLKNVFGNDAGTTVEQAEANAVPSFTTLAYYSVIGLGVWYVYKKAMKA